MKKTKLKLKKIFYIIPIILILLTTATFIGIKAYQNYQYEQTNEYKLLNIGYTLDEINLLSQNLTTDKLTELTTQEKNSYLFLFV